MKCDYHFRIWLNQETVGWIDWTKLIKLIEFISNSKIAYEFSCFTSSIPRYQDTKVDQT